MKISYLRHFIAIYEEKNLTRAAAILHTSQPALTNELNNLEKRFETPLFIRQNKGLFPTKAADVLYKGARDIISRVDLLSDEMAVFSQNTKLVRIGIPPILSTLIFPNLVSGLRKKYPETQLNVSERGSIVNLLQVKEGQLDAAIISGNQPLGANIESRELTKLKICLYVSIENPIAVHREVGFEGIRDLQFVSLKDDSFLGFFLQSYFKEHGAVPNIALSSSQLQLIRHLVNNNSAAAILYEGALETEDGIVAIPLTDIDSVPVRFIWNRQMSAQPSIKNILRILETGQRTPVDPT